MLRRSDDNGADLLVAEELDGSVGEDAQQRGRVATKQTTYAICVVDVPDCSDDSKPGTGVFGELGIGRLEQDFDAVQRTNNCFSLGFVKHQPRQV